MMNPFMAVVTLSFLAIHPARAQEVDYTDAISRQILLVNKPSVEYTDAISRQILLVNANTGIAYEDAISRLVLYYLPPYTSVEVQKALSLAAGSLQATQNDMNRLNIIREGESADRIDVRDVVRIVRMAAGLDQ